MNPKDLAKAMQDERLRDSLTEDMTHEEASAFEAYVSEYAANELIINKNDRA